MLHAIITIESEHSTINKHLPNIRKLKGLTWQKTQVQDVLKPILMKRFRFWTSFLGQAFQYHLL